MCPGGTGSRFAFGYGGSEPAACSFLMTRRVSSPKGVEGGRPGEPARLLINGEVRDPVSVKQLTHGDVILIETAGGGGFGSV